MSERMNYPEHEKLSAIRDKSQEIGNFMEWLGVWEMSICRLDRLDKFWPISETKEVLLAEFFEIDLKKLEAEKRKMLAALEQP